MMLFLTVAVVHLLALMTPGPDFFFVSQTALSRSRAEALRAVIGISLGVVVWAAVALMGLHLLLLKMAWLQRIITLGGGLYLCWMGWQMLCAARRPVSDDAPRLAPLHGSAFWRGVLTNLSNPKAVIYFGSVFSLFVGDEVGVGQRLGLFVLIVAETVLWFSLVASVFALPVMRRGYQRLARWIDGVAGSLFTAFGLHLILTR
ncbi:threonine export protein RhtC [Edwardsiella hoshinae]|uniref:Threonine efflux protein n=1 Tax=Edwardsiella hoshinae TaxID=93378 RepID=A0A376DMP9_9GAMM|nr:threonine export protein RhtC [Edwardsiella hoshinae]AOV98326.1 threonine export protein RhtC [Edwardsiella hoshinae]QPR28821.1 threonine export protein RhtC [Edwardsiella hoshinae]STC92101.1 Threonine efflux protein [Edwardsiella hoshinae]